MSSTSSSNAPARAERDYIHYGSDKPVLQWTLYVLHWSMGDSGTGRGRSSGGGWHAPIDDTAKGLFLAGLKRGLYMEDAARTAGFSAGAFWKARKRDPAFDEAVGEMLELSSAPRFVAPGNGRRWQLRRVRRLRFVPW